MKKIVDYLKSEKYSVLSIAMALVSVFIGGGVMMADATVVVSTDTATASEGQAGLDTQVLGSPTTVSAVSQATGGVGGDNLIQPDIDDDIYLIGTDETVLDSIMRKAKKKQRVNAWEVDHYMIDEKKASVLTTAAYSVPQAGAEEQATLTVAAADRNYFQDYGTLLAKGVNGYDETGQTVQTGVDLMLFIVGKDSNKNPIVRAVNGAKANATDEYSTVPAIPSGTELVLMANACAETQKYVAPNVVVPTPKRVYLQKMILNQLVSDYFDAQRKRVPFQQAVIAEAMVKQFRRECNRSLWIGHKGKLNIDRGTMGVQTVYTTEGIRWQFAREYDHYKYANGASSGNINPWTFEEIIELAKMKFTGQDTSKSAWWLMGKDMLEKIQNIDFTKHKDITMTADTTWGFSCTKLHTVFGDFFLKHEPTLDYIGYSNQGGIIDTEGLVRYYMKNEEASTENVEGEEAKRKCIISINALALKGTSHIWVDGDATA